MKKLAAYLGITLMVLAIVGTSEVYALNFGDEITISDKKFTAEDWHGENEDGEVEPGMRHGQEWDLEGFFKQGTELTMIGGYDFVNGEDGSGHWDSGDIFIDVTGDVQYGRGTPGPEGGRGNHSMKNVFGYDFVLDMDFETLTYDIYSIDNTADVTSAYFRANNASNAWRYEGGGDLLGSGTIDYMTGLSDDDVGFLGDSHNAVTVDLGFLGDAINDFTAHFTMQCGNDNLMGHYDPVPQTSTSPDPVPEPSTILLLGLGILGLVGFARKRTKK
jgi:hypothetical protein